MYLVRSVRVCCVRLCARVCALGTCVLCANAPGGEESCLGDFVATLFCFLLFSLHMENNPYYGETGVLQAFRVPPQSEQTV